MSLTFFFFFYCVLLISSSSRYHVTSGLSRTETEIWFVKSVGQSATLVTRCRHLKSELNGRSLICEHSKLWWREMKVARLRSTGVRTRRFSLKRRTAASLRRSWDSCCLKRLGWSRRIPTVKHTVSVTLEYGFHFLEMDPEKYPVAGQRNETKGNLLKDRGHHGTNSDCKRSWSCWFVLVTSNFMASHRKTSHFYHT